MLTASSIDVHYGPVQALRGVTLRVEPGEMVALLGANGAGKTTTLRALSGLLDVTAGTVEWNGERIDGIPAHRIIGRGIAHLPEGRELFPEMTVTENLQLGHWTQRRDRAGERARIDEMMDIFPRLRERWDQMAGTSPFMSPSPWAGWVSCRGTTPCRWPRPGTAGRWSSAPS